MAKFKTVPKSLPEGTQKDVTMEDGRNPPVVFTHAEIYYFRSHLEEHGGRPQQRF